MITYKNIRDIKMDQAKEILDRNQTDLETLSEDAKNTLTATITDLINTTYSSRMLNKTPVDDHKMTTNVISSWVNKNSKAIGELPAVARVVFDKVVEHLKRFFDAFHRTVKDERDLLTAVMENPDEATFRNTDSEGMMAAVRKIADKYNANPIEVREIFRKTFTVVRSKKSKAKRKLAARAMNGSASGSGSSEPDEAPRHEEADVLMVTSCE